MPRSMMGEMGAAVRRIITATACRGHTQVQPSLIISQTQGQHAAQGNTQHRASHAALPRSATRCSVLAISLPTSPPPATAQRVARDIACPLVRVDFLVAEATLDRPLVNEVTLWCAGRDPGRLPAGAGAAGGVRSGLRPAVRAAPGVKGCARRYGLRPALRAAPRRRCARAAVRAQSGLDVAPGPHDAVVRVPGYVAREHCAGASFGCTRVR